jgi:hypothetical protein
MSIGAGASELRLQAESYGPVAYLVTVGDGRRPHAVSVVLAWSGDDLTTAAGTRTAANIGDGAVVTLLWPPPPGGDYSLIVDGDAVVAVGSSGPQVVVRPRSAVQHRVATASGEGPGCLPVSVEPAVPVES